MAHLRAAPPGSRRQTAGPAPLGLDVSIALDAGIALGLDAGITLVPTSATAPAQIVALLPPAGQPDCEPTATLEPPGPTADGAGRRPGPSRRGLAAS